MCQLYTALPIHVALAKNIVARSASAGYPSKLTLARARLVPVSSPLGAAHRTSLPFVVVPAEYLVVALTLPVSANRHATPCESVSSRVHASSTGKSTTQIVTSVPPSIGPALGARTSTRGLCASASRVVVAVSVSVSVIARETRRVGARARAPLRGTCLVPSLVRRAWSRARALATHDAREARDGRFRRALERDARAGVV